MGKHIYMLVLLSFMYFYSTAQVPPSGTGCYFNGKVYYQNVQPTPTFGFNYRYRYDPNYYYELTCTDNVYAELGSPLTTGIFGANVNCGPSSSYSANTGTMYYITVMNCPIDHLNALLIFPLGIIGIWKIRKAYLRQLNSRINKS